MSLRCAVVLFLAAVAVSGAAAKPDADGLDFHLCPAPMTGTATLPLCGNRGRITCEVQFNYVQGLQPWCDPWAKEGYAGFVWNPRDLNYTCPSGSRFTKDPATNKNFCLWVDLVPNDNLGPTAVSRDCKISSGYLKLSYSVTCDTIAKQVFDAGILQACPTDTSRSDQSKNSYCSQYSPQYGVNFNCYYPTWDGSSQYTEWCGKDNPSPYPTLAIKWDSRKYNLTCPAPSVWGTDGIKRDYCQWPFYSNPTLAPFASDPDSICDYVSDGEIGYSVSFYCENTVEYFVLNKTNSPGGMFSRNRLTGTMPLRLPKNDLPKKNY